jgi:CubicO group peptidase (beta-lactamase class C family)
MKFTSSRKKTGMFDQENEATHAERVRLSGSTRATRTLRQRWVVLAAVGVLGATAAGSAQPASSDSGVSSAAQVGSGAAGRRDVNVDAKPQPAGAAVFDWSTADPESQGMSSVRLEALWKDLRSRRTTALLIVRNDRIVHESYAAGQGPAKIHGAASLAKAVVAGLSLAVALTDGRIALDDRAALYVPAWKDDPLKSRITIRQLGSHSSGLEDAEQDLLPHAKLTGWKGDFWKALPPPNDPFTIARDRVPVLFQPGTRLQYSNPAVAMLTYAVTASLRDAPRNDIRTLLRDRMMRPIGVPDREWSAGYSKTYEVDGLPLVASWGGGGYTARALARIGRLVLRGGDWDGVRILSQEAVRQMTTSAGLPGACGMGWWTNGAGRYANLPRDAAWGAGAGDQVLLVVPSLDLIMVRNGETLAPPPKSADPADNFAMYHDERTRILFDPLIAAVRPAHRSAAPAPSSSASPYPGSSLIKDITWAPKKTMLWLSRVPELRQQLLRRARRVCLFVFSRFG